MLFPIGVLVSFLLLWGELTSLTMPVRTGNLYAGIQERVEEGDPPTSPVLVDITEESGIDFVHFNGMTGEFFLPEITGSGGALVDYDNDGDMDLYLVQGAILGAGRKPEDAIFPWQGSGPPRDRLYRNDLSVQADGRRSVRFTDVTGDCGVLATGYGFGAAAGDVNNDGWPDLYVTNLASNQMFRNNGNGTFSDVTRETGTHDSSWSTSAAFLDYDRDGWLDLFVANYVNFAPEKSATVTPGAVLQTIAGPTPTIQLPIDCFTTKATAPSRTRPSLPGSDPPFGRALA